MSLVTFLQAGTVVLVSIVTGQWTKGPLARQFVERKVHPLIIVDVHPSCLNICTAERPPEIDQILPWKCLGSQSTYLGTGDSLCLCMGESSLAFFWSATGPMLKTCNQFFLTPKLEKYVQYECFGNGRKLTSVLTFYWILEILKFHPSDCQL